MSKKTLTIVLAGSPYGGERAAQALRLAAAALDRGHAVNLFASADGTYAAVSDQAAKGLPNIGKELEELVARGLRVELCGSCLRFRGLSADRLVAGTQPSTLKGLGAMLREADAVLNL
jgi:tRNA 2-thiouridine synthesizing protein D